MPLIRLLLLLLVLAGLSLLLVQNWSPVLPLVFLGMRAQALPLALWILICFAAGAFTSLAIASLFRLSHYFAAIQPTRRQPRVKATQKATSNTQRSESSASAERPPSNNAGSGSNHSNVSDWDSETTDDDWNVDDTKEKQDFNRDEVKSTTYERQQQPQSSSQTGSVYSYSYKEPKNSGVGKTESVYDAEYRVITPPFQQTNTAKPKEEEDWGFDDEDEE
ncbi:MAG: hypothetical protein JO235_10230 [Chroococcidiopsidaceae cyanobacterium CP_BM_RX_35]|nr:hypothetical protein [Chroococcidiopsidaceae cyanobacterium CP_BM_RX_35]